MTKDLDKRVNRFPKGNPVIIERSLIALIFITALLVRIWGINFGLPYEYHVDEDQYVRQAATMGANGLEPANWYNPPFLKYILLGEYGLLYVIGKSLGMFASTADFGSQMTIDPTWLYLLARLTSVLFGTFTILIIYWIGDRAYNRKVGILGALFVAVAFLPVRESHFAVNDAAVTFWMMLALLAAVRILRSPDWRWYALGGIAMGLGFATKYIALIAIIPLLIAHFYTPGAIRNKQAYSRLITLLILMVVSAVLASPYFILTPGKVLANASELFLSGQQGFGNWQIDPTGGFLFYIKTLIWGLGSGFLLLNIVGMLGALIRHDPVDLVILSIPVLMFLYLGSQQMYFGRFMLPLIPPMIILAASFLEKFVISIFTTSTSRRLGLIVLVILFIAQPLSSTIRFDMLMSRVDTRTLAKQWVEQNISEGAGIAMDWPFFCAPLSTKEIPKADANRTYQVWVSEFGFGEGLFDHPLEWYLANGYDSLIACSYIYQIQLVDEDDNKLRQKFYQSLDERLTLVKEIQPYDGKNELDFIFDEIYGPAVSLWQRERPGPTIKIYKIHR
jgi:hypothetical protein